MSCLQAVRRIPPRPRCRPFSPRPWIVAWAGLWIALSTSQSLPAACLNLSPSFSITVQVQVVASGGGFFPREANLAVNTDLPEVLFTFLGTSDVPHTDPITGQPAFWGLFGVFYDPRTAQAMGPPFLIVGNPHGDGERHDVKYNPGSRRYVAAVSARNYPPNNAQLVLMAWVNPSTTNASNRVARAFVHQPQSTISFQDVALAVSTNNGHCLLVAEYKVPGEGEAVIGALFDAHGNLLTDGTTRLDHLQPAGDEDDPDVVYLPGHDVFLFVVNTDFGDGVRNRVTGTVIETRPDPSGGLRTGQQQYLSSAPVPDRWEGHPAAMENPFNGDIITAFDLGGNSVAEGRLVLHRPGTGPDYLLSATRPEAAYLTAMPLILLNHNHPQLAADPHHGVMAVVYSAFSSGIVPDSLRFKLLGPTGAILPCQPPEGHLLAPTEGPLAPADPNCYNVKHDPVSGAFIAVYGVPGGAVGAAWLQVHSHHLRPALSLELVPNELGVPGFELSWAASYDGFQLESANALTATEWTPIDSPPTVHDGLNTIRVDLDRERRFFRLRNGP